MTAPKQPTQEQFEEALNDAVNSAYSMVKDGEALISVAEMRSVFNAGHALGQRLNPWRDPDLKLPTETGWVICYFFATGNQIVCFFNRPVLVRQAEFMVDGGEVRPDRWKYLDAKPAC